MPTPTPLAIGDRLPDFTATDHTGRTIRSGDLVGKRALVVYFYPKNNTPACTAEACEFRNFSDEFAAAGAEVLGVSGDSDPSHRAFAARFKLPFGLVSDSSGELRRLFGVPKTFGLLPGRVTYVFDAAGVLRHVFSSQLRAKAHVEEALKTVRGMSTGTSAGR
jgi:thioredoxin-dependent peroxiredoxin